MPETENKMVTTGKQAITLKCQNIFFIIEKKID